MKHDWIDWWLISNRTDSLYANEEALDLFKTSIVSLSPAADGCDPVSAAELQALMSQSDQSPLVRAKRSDHDSNPTDSDGGEEADPFPPGPADAEDSDTDSLVDAEPAVLARERTRVMEVVSVSKDRQLFLRLFQSRFGALSFISGILTGGRAWCRRSSRPATSRLSTIRFRGKGE